jgi:hypothetical protein
MADTGIINLESGMVEEKRGRGGPRGSKNKPKAPIAQASSSTPAKRRYGRPLGSKNKTKVSTKPADINEHLDVSLVQPNPPQPSAGDSFSFFVFASAQCRAQQRLPLKLTEINGWSRASRGYSARGV